MSVFCLDKIEGKVKNFVLEFLASPTNITKKFPHIDKVKSSIGGNKMDTSKVSQEMIQTDSGKNFVSFSQKSKSKDDFHEFLARLLLKNEQFKASRS
jgi:hypothetical protein